MNWRIGHYKMIGPNTHITKWNYLALPIYRLNCTPNDIGQNAYIWSAICVHMVSDAFQFSTELDFSYIPPMAMQERGAPGYHFGPLAVYSAYTRNYCSVPNDPNFRTQNNEMMYDRKYIPLYDWLMIRLPKWYGF